MRCDMNDLKKLNGVLCHGHTIKRTVNPNRPPPGADGDGGD